MASGYGLSGGMFLPYIYSLLRVLPFCCPPVPQGSIDESFLYLPIHVSLGQRERPLTNFADHVSSPLFPFLGPSRCFPFWQDLLACYVVNTSADDISGAKKCLPVMEDYYECLHHRKEVRCF